MRQMYCFMSTGICMSTQRKVVEAGVGWGGVEGIVPKYQSEPQREREGDRQTETTQRDRERDGDRDKQTQRQRETGRQREGETETDTDTDRQADRCRDRQTENSNSKTLILKDSSIRSIRTYLTASRMTDRDRDRCRERSTKDRRRDHGLHRQKRTGIAKDEHKRDAGFFVAN